MTGNRHSARSSAFDREGRIFGDGGYEVCCTGAMKAMVAFVVVLLV